MVEGNVESEWSFGVFFLPPRFFKRQPMEKNWRFCYWGINCQGSLFSVGQKPNWGQGQLIVDVST